MPDLPAPPTWDTFAFFEEMLAAFPAVVASIIQDKETYEERALEAARNGFARYWSLDDWGTKETHFIEGYLRGGYSIDALHWFEEYAEAVGVFALFVIGGLVVKRGIGEIEPVGYLLGEAHLPAFLSLENPTIYRYYTTSYFASPH